VDYAEESVMEKVLRGMLERPEFENDAQLGLF
jgi:hypothetical protein